VGEAVYILCAVTSLVCSILLVRAYLSSKSPLLLWSSVCFVGLFVNNVVLVVDVVLMTEEVDLLLVRDLTNTSSVVALVFGLVWSSR